MIRSRFRFTMKHNKYQTRGWNVTSKQEKRFIIAPFATLRMIHKGLGNVGAQFINDFSLDLVYQYQCKYYPNLPPNNTPK